MNGRVQRKYQGCATGESRKTVPASSGTAERRLHPPVEEDQQQRDRQREDRHPSGLAEGGLEHQEPGLVEPPVAGEVPEAPGQLSETRREPPIQQPRREPGQRDHRRGPEGGEQHPDGPPRLPPGREQEEREEHPAHDLGERRQRGETRGGGRAQGLGGQQPEREEGQPEGVAVAFARDRGERQRVPDVEHDEPGMQTAAAQQQDQREDEHSLGGHQRPLHRRRVDRDPGRRPEEELRRGRIDRRQLPVVHPRPDLRQRGGEIRQFGGVGRVAVGVTPRRRNPALPDHPVEVGLRRGRYADEKSPADEPRREHSQQHPARSGSGLASPHQG